MITETEVGASPRFASALKLATVDRTIYICLTHAGRYAGELSIREDGFPPLRYGNPHAAYMVVRSALLNPGKATTLDRERRRAAR